MAPKKGWETFEADVQSLLDLDSTSASGNQWHDPSDGVTRGHITETVFPLMVDCKQTVRKSFSLQRAFLAQWREKAELLGKRFAMPIRFEDGPSRIPTREDYIVLPLDDFAELLDLAKRGAQ